MVLALVLIGLVTLVLAGCGGGQTSSTTSAAANTAPVSPADKVDSGGAHSAAGGARAGSQAPVGHSRKPLPPVAAVAGQPIPRAQFDRWYPALLDSLGRGKASAAARAAARRQVMQLLIGERWALTAAPAEGVTVSAAAVAGLISRCGASGSLLQCVGGPITRPAALSPVLAATPQSAAAQAQESSASPARQLRSVGLAMADLRKLARSQLLLGALVTKAKRTPPPPPSPAEIAAYYRAHHVEHVGPTVDLILTHTLAKARAARAALERGESFARVARAYTYDLTLRDTGGRVEDWLGAAGKNPYYQLLRDRKPRQLVGPVRAVPRSSGWALLRLLRKPSDLNVPYSQLAPQIRSMLENRRRPAALSSFAHDYVRRWRARTRCTRGYTVAECGGSLR